MEKVHILSCSNFGGSDLRFSTFSIMMGVVLWYVDFIMQMYVLSFFNLLFLLFLCYVYEFITCMYV